MSAVQRATNTIFVVIIMVSNILYFSVFYHIDSFDPHSYSEMLRDCYSYFRVAITVQGSDLILLFLF
jgi:hypothetical protein